jgi:hypothetical protein
MKKLPNSYTSMNFKSSLTVRGLFHISGILVNLSNYYYRTFEETKLGIVTAAHIAAKCWIKIGHFIRLYEMGRSFMFHFC